MPGRLGNCDLCDLVALPKGWRPGETVSRYVQAQRLGPKTYNAEARTVEAILATGYRVRRWFGFEELAIREEAIDLRRLALGHVKLLDHHNASKRDVVLGVVTSARIERGRLVGTITFADNEAGRAAERDVAAGNLTGISVGYQIHKLVLIETSDDRKDDVFRAERWESLEVSLVSVPADLYAGVRSASPRRRRSSHIEIIRMRMRMRAAMLGDR
jgi:HK97 family phage prohead protease